MFETIWTNEHTSSLSTKELRATGSLVYSGKSVLFCLDVAYLLMNRLSFCCRWHPRRLEREIK